MKSRTLTGVNQALALGLLLSGVSALMVAHAADRQMDQDRDQIRQQDQFHK